MSPSKEEFQEVVARKRKLTIKKTNSLAFNSRIIGLPQPVHQNPIS
jgi:hypothetical protein